MAEKKIVTTKTTDLDQTTTTDQRAGSFLEKNGRTIIFVGLAVIAAIAGWYAYQAFVKKPNERKANEMIFAAESLFDKMASATGFNKDSSIFVLNGNSEAGITGVLKVIKEYGGTEAGNRAKYIAGATYLHLKEFPKAIDHLKEFDADGAHQVESKAYIMIGHAYAEQNKTGEALEYYKKAANVNKKDDVTTAEALVIAASYADAINNKKEAIELYTRLKNEHPTATAVKSGDVDKYLARLGIFK
jgi:tetratricopeptide (TPR) repeat protein